jgi:ABC-type amino acid transport substrate-binding protein
MMAGLAVTPVRAATMTFSNAYLDGTLAFVVRDHLRHDFLSWSKIRSLRSVRVGVPNVPYYVREIQDRLPNLHLQVIDDLEGIVDHLELLDAIVLPAERGSVITLLHPQYTAVVPAPDIVKIPLAYPLACHDQDWAHFINTWIDLKRKDRTIDRLYEHWILGQAAEEHQPRWSIIGNVLNWR